MDLNEFDSKLKRFMADLPRNVQRINKSLALSTIPIIKKRLIERGETGEGKSLGKYSEKKLNPAQLLPQALGVQAERRIESHIKQQAKKGEPIGISYKKFRELNNRPTDHVTLSFSGETLGDISIVDEEISESEVITTVGSRNSKTKEVHNKKGKKTGTVGTGDVLDFLGERYGDILSLTPEEEREIEEAFDDEIQSLLDEYFEND